MLEIQASGTLFHDPHVFLANYSRNDSNSLAGSDIRDKTVYNLDIISTWYLRPRQFPAPAMLIGIIVIHLHAQLHIYTINLFIYDLI